MAENTKEKRIKAELKRLQAKFELVDANQREVVAQLLQNAAFMAVTLQDLQEIINAQGVTDEYRNGANQYGTKASATLQSYNALIKNYANVIKTLAQLVPPERKPEPPAPPKPTPEEAEAEREETERRRKLEMEQAIEYQRAMKEYTGPPASRPSFSQWRAMQENSD